MLEPRSACDQHAYSLLDRLVCSARHYLQTEFTPEQQIDMIRIDAQRILPMLRSEDCDRVVEFVLEQLSVSGPGPLAESAKVIPFPLDRRT